MCPEDFVYSIVPNVPKLIRTHNQDLKSSWIPTRSSYFLSGAGDRVRENQECLFIFVKLSLARDHSWSTQ